jgi:predicted esterase
MLITALVLGLVLPPAMRDTLPRGHVVPVVTSLSDTAERYALYLPSRYDPTKRWPVLIVMDPRGRALRAEALFEEGAERDGYVVLSSYNTLSDSTEEPNVKALNAILGDIQSRYSVDPHRVYLAGFSGTAKLAWGYAFQLRGLVAGVIGFGAALPWQNLDATVAMRGISSLAFFGGAGTLDFNYDAVMTLDDWLDSLPAIPHRVMIYPGPHNWAPAAVCGQAVDWMQLQAMRSKLTPVDDSVVRNLYDAWSAAARAARESGDVYTAWREYRSIVADFSGLHDVRAASAAVAELARSPALRHSIDQRRRLLSADSSYNVRVLYPYFARFEEPHPPSAAASLRTLDVAAFQRRAADSTDRLASDAAQRTLNMLYSLVDFYEPRHFLAAGDSARVSVLLEMAHAIYPPDSAGGN